MLFALHSELINIYGKKLRFVSVMLTCLIIILFIFDPLSKYEESESQKQINSLKDSLTVLRDSIINSKILIASAETSKIYSNRNLNMAKKYFASSNKPIISIGEFSVDTLLPNKPIALHCTIENTGNALAKKVSYYILVNFHTVPLYNGTFPIGKISGSSPLAPHKTFGSSYTEEQPLSQELYNKIQNKEWYLYYFGVVYYCDELGTKDSTAFCVIYNINSERKFIYNTSHNY